MKWPFFLLFIAIAMSVSAQSECKYDLNKKDAFTGERKSITKAERLAVQVDGNLHVRAVYENEKYFLRFTLALNKPFIIPKGNQVWIMLNDDNILKVNVKNEGNGSKAIGKTSKYEATFDLDLSDDQWQILMANPVKRMRFMLAEGHYDIVVKPEKATVLQELMKSI